MAQVLQHNCLEESQVMETIHLPNYPALRLSTATMDRLLSYKK